MASTARFSEVVVGKAKAQLHAFTELGEPELRVTLAGSICASSFLKCLHGLIEHRRMLQEGVVLGNDANWNAVSIAVEGKANDRIQPRVVADGGR